MAHTFGPLWPQLVSWENLCAAYGRCRRRKRARPEAAAFDFAWETEVLRLQRELREGTYSPGAYRNFYIHEPKRRKISAAPFRDRVVHHAIVRVLEPLYEPRFIHDSYACRRKKGTHRALHRAQYYARRHRFFLKSDIVRFFPNADHAVLLETIFRRVREPRTRDLVAKIIASGAGVLTEEATHDVFPGDDLFSRLRPTGLPIGNLTSQFFANVLLDPVDHFVKEGLRVPGYVRYADDFVLFGDRKEQLWEWRDALRSRLARLRLKLHREKTQIRPSLRGLKFLGFVLRPSGRRLQQSALKRFNRRLRRLKWRWRCGQISLDEIRASLRSTHAHAQFANSQGVLRDVWRRARFERCPLRSARACHPRPDAAHN
jgi:retron-type reverse transcriptase